MQNRIILGDMPMPKNFKYLNVYLQGKPQHEPFDSFRLKHPSMPLQKRAKIFAPFDALRGFDFVYTLSASASCSVPSGSREKRLTKRQPSSASIGWTSWAFPCISMK